MEHKQAGNVLYSHSQWEKARESYTKALEVDPLMTAALANRAACSIQLGDYSNALRDCEEALTTATGNLRTKTYWRQAVSLRNLGTDKRQWESAVNEGLKLDANNDKLLEEKTFIFVQKVPSMPAVYLSDNSSRNSAPKPVAPAAAVPETSSKPASGGLNSTMALPNLPLTYHGLLQLIRMKTSESVNFWYSKVTGSDLQGALKTAGLEPDTLDYICKLIVENPGQPKNAEFLHALRMSPRFETALFMADEKLYQSAVQASQS